MLIAVTVVAYEASATIEELLDRIPQTIAGAAPLVLVSDDASSDNTFELVERWAARNPQFEVAVIRQAVNLGYGGNQRAMYQWAHEKGVDVAILLHGDGQYPPEMSDDLVRPIVEGTADVVHGSRMLLAGGARRGRMPLDRRIGNRVLSRIFNVLSGADLSEWFSGYRAYCVPTLLQVDLAKLPSGFDFDTAITLRLLENGNRIAEVAIPTHYGDEISRVPLLHTGFAGLAHAFEHWRNHGRSHGKAARAARDRSAEA